mgnify:CR=1 FL=1
MYMQIKHWNQHARGSSSQEEWRRVPPVILGIERIGQYGAEESEEPLLVAFGRDITEQKGSTEMEIEIRAAEELLCNICYPQRLRLV